jgi:hypothetical protein
MKNIQDNQLKYKISFNGIEKTLKIEISKDNFYIKFEDIQLSNKKNVLDTINNIFKNNFITKEEYTEILNRISYELCISQVNERLYHDLYFTLCRKNILDNSLFEVIFNQK